MTLPGSLWSRRMVHGSSPSAFEYILEHQASFGARESHSSAIDAILNTLASLLTMKVHNRDGQFDGSISRAIVFLSSCLGSWDVSSTDRVGFEITVPSLLNALSKLGIEFSFPQRSLLMDLNDAKLTKIPPCVVYDLGTPLLHTLSRVLLDISISIESPIINVMGHSWHHRPRLPRI